LLACAIDCLITLKMGDRKLPYQRLQFEIQNQRLEIGDGRWEMGDERLSITDWIMNIEQWILNIEYWILNIEYRISNIEYWILKIEYCSREFLKFRNVEISKSRTSEVHNAGSKEVKKWISE
jgi:hypothetical protein